MQQITSTRVAELICNFLLGDQSENDKEVLDSWLAANEHNRTYFHEVTTPGKLKALLAKPKLINVKVARSIWNKIARGIAQSQALPPSEHSITSATLLSPSN